MSAQFNFPMEHGFTMKSLKWMRFLTLLSFGLVIGCGGSGSAVPEQGDIEAYVSENPESGTELDPQLEEE